MTNFIEKQYLINQIQLDQFLLNIIKDYCFESKNTHDKNIRQKERNIRFITPFLISNAHFEMRFINNFS